MEAIDAHVTVVSQSQPSLYLNLSSSPTGWAAYFTASASTIPQILHFLGSQAAIAHQDQASENPREEEKMHNLLLPAIYMSLH